MESSWLRLGTVLVLFDLMIFSAQLTLGQDQPNKQVPQEALRVIDFQGDLRSLLRSLADTYNVVIGFEADSQSPLMVKVQARDVDFHQLLDNIVISHPQYRWREVDGSIEFTAVSGGSPVLDTFIKTFEVKDASFSDATNTLLNLPEIQGALTTMALTRNEEGYRPRNSGNTFSLRLERVTMRQALNEMARKSGTNFWSFRRFGNNERFFSLHTLIYE